MSADVIKFRSPRAKPYVAAWDEYMRLVRLNWNQPSRESLLAKEAAYKIWRELVTKFD